MLYESPRLRVPADDGIAAVWLGFPGSPVNALCARRVAELGRALDAALADPHLEVIVIRSDLPAGFCGGYVPGTLAGLIDDEDATAFSRAGQRVCEQLAAAEPVTVAFLEGPCVGPGLELALACDYRLAVAGPESWFGFPDARTGLPPCWGGATRTRQLVGNGKAAALLDGTKIPTAREACRLGLIDDAFSRRRGKIELQTWLDRLQGKPTKPRRPELSFADERTAFRRAVRTVPVERRASIPFVPEPRTPAETAVEAALRGGESTLPAAAAVEVARLLDEAVRHGRATPLEADHARGRIAFAELAATRRKTGGRATGSRRNTSA